MALIACAVTVFALAARPASELPGWHPCGRKTRCLGGAGAGIIGGVGGEFELGSAVVTARLARDLMRLWLLMHCRYPPYSKWLGSALARAPGGAGLGAPLTAAVAATGWPERERQLGLAYRIAAEAHNRLGLTEPLDPGTRPYYTRPYQVLDAGRFAAALSGAITDPLVGRLPPVGAADQVIDSTPALGDLRYPRAVTSVSDRDMPVLGVGDTQT